MGWTWYDGKDRKMHKYPDSQSLFTKEEAEKLLEMRKKEFNAKQFKFYIEEF